jgi:hypothetical protein
MSMRKSNRTRNAHAKRVSNAANRKAKKERADDEFRQGYAQRMTADARAAAKKRRKAEMAALTAFGRLMAGETPSNIPVDLAFRRPGNLNK